MGIQGFLPRVLPTAGREDYDLRAFSDGIISISPRPLLSSLSSSSFTSPHGHDDNHNHRRPDNDSTATNKRSRSLSHNVTVETITTASIGKKSKSTSSSWTRRPVRIAVDVNGWIARACHGYGGYLMDERHLSYHGRAQLHKENNERNRLVQQQQQQQQQRLEYITKCTSFVLERLQFLRKDCGALVLPVLDGLSPPVKQSIVLQRSHRRKEALHVRDRIRSMDTTTTNNNNNNNNNQYPRGDNNPSRGLEGAEEEDDEEEEEKEEGNTRNEAARTEAEVMQRISASKRAGCSSGREEDSTLRRDILSSLLRELQKRSWPVLVAPYEADGQLAYLANTNIVDVVVTEDSDLIALGVPRLIYKLGGWNGTNDSNRNSYYYSSPWFTSYVGPKRYTATTTTSRPLPPSQHHQQQQPQEEEEEVEVESPYLRGTLLLRSNLGSCRDLDLLDFSNAMIATMFVAAGCDYCPSLKGIGIGNAHTIVKNAFFNSSDTNDVPRQRRRRRPILRTILNDLFLTCHKDVRQQYSLSLEDDTEKGMSSSRGSSLRAEYERAFLAALAMYRHPVVYDPILEEHVIANDVSSFHSDSSCSAQEVVSGNGDESVYARRKRRRRRMITTVCPLFLAEEQQLMEYMPYKELVTIRENLYQVVGRPMPPKIAKGIAEGLLDPRQLSRHEMEGGVDEDEEAIHWSNMNLRADNGDDAPILPDFGELMTQENSRASDDDGEVSFELATQEEEEENIEGVGTTQQSKSSSGTSGMISSLSPDLLASPMSTKRVR